MTFHLNKYLRCHLFVSSSFAFIFLSPCKYLLTSLPFSCSGRSTASFKFCLWTTNRAWYRIKMMWPKWKFLVVSCDADSCDVLLKQTQERTHDVWREKQDRTDSDGMLALLAVLCITGLMSLLIFTSLRGAWQKTSPGIPAGSGYPCLFVLVWPLLLICVWWHFWIGLLVSWYYWTRLPISWQQRLGITPKNYF